MAKKDKKPSYFTEEEETYQVFVYGTLKSGGDIRGLNQFGDGATIVGKAKTTYPDYEMTDLGAFPGVFENGEYHIEGEVWEVNSQILSELDAIEGYLTVINYEKSLEATKKNYDAVLKATEEIKTKFDLGS